ncbi:L,D-transpeptidase family protein [Marinobacterium sedimentorum]|uniref:L,D-transpeptidase family protein n=1 Tax=Marinobacterium sedimentorum TaxID=2927804 RepID=UPI0020C6546F|nr:L,D-transpeptidase family protein [Marinobacterium sedimentorum]MCP8686205.1 L,D-transpeptidase family protein [Marinobacterium sedimentorum]
MTYSRAGRACHRVLRAILALVSALACTLTSAETFVLPPPDQDLVGEVRITRARQADTLLDIARAFNLGYEEIVRANPGVDRWLPGPGTDVVLPNLLILPDAPRDGIVLNVPEMRLYYYPKPAQGEVPVVITHPVSVGRMDWKTPLGKTSVIQKQADPPWYPPASIKAEHAANGDILPDVVPGGPGNPLGRFALRLGIPGYLIHGTDKEYGIGMQVTHGCVRLYPEDIERLYELVPVGTPVYIVNQPVKIGRHFDALYIESHPALAELSDNGQNPQAMTLLTIAATAEQRQTDVIPSAVELVLEQSDGIPQRISR